MTQSRIGAQSRISPILILLAASSLAACNIEGRVGYVEIKMAPASLGAPPSLYLGSTKLQPIKKGTTVLTQPVGQVKLQIEGAGGNNVALCDILVKKDRITTVTVSVMERPPRCQCRITSGPDSRVCVG